MDRIIWTGRRAALLGATLAAAGLIAAGPGLAKPERADAATTVRAAMDSEGSVITDAERARIRAACGEDADGSDSLSLNGDDGALTCANGRKIVDPEIRALVARISDRARARVASVMQRTEVAQAIQGEAVARARAEIAAIDTAKLRAEARRAVEAAQVELAALDIDAITTAAMEAALAEIADIDVDAIVREVEADLARERRRLDDEAD